LPSDEATLTLCGPCRHFEQALVGPHACALGLPLRDGVQVKECAHFHPFALGEGSLMDQSDCCAHGHQHETKA
jgi:hypothetical protein